MPKLRVFLCHSSGDKVAVRHLYERLRGDGFAPWLDEEDLLPGQEWRREIPKAVANAHVVLVCLSRSSITKQGFVQKEIKYALDAAAEQPEGMIYIIPLRLEACEVPQRLSEWHRVDLFDQRGYERLLRALHARAQTLRGEGRRAVAAEPPSRAGTSAPNSRRAPATYAPRGVPDAPPAAETEGFGLAMGFNLVWLSGTPFMAEVEISSYVDALDELGATLVFHPLEYTLLLSPDDVPAFRLDIDDDLQRDLLAPAKTQLQNIARQLSRLSEDQLRTYLLRAMESQ